MATNVTNTAFLVGNGFSQDGNTPMDLLVQAYRRTRQGEITKLTDRQDKLTKRQVFFNSLRSKLEDLLTSAGNFTSSTAPDKFTTKKTTTSDATVATVSASASATAGVNSLKVERLATKDVLVSDQKTLASTTGFGTSTKSFSINGRTYNVDTTSGETNEQLMTKIVSAVNNDTGSKVTAALVKDTSTTGRLSFTSDDSGYDGRITFSDTGGVLSGFGFGTVTQSSSSTLPSLTSTQFRTTDKPLGITAGLKTFAIDGISYNVNYTTNDDYQTIYNNIAGAINANPSSKVNATVSVINGNKVELSVTNKNLNEALSIDDSAYSYLSNFGLGTQTIDNSRTKFSDTKAGYQTGTETSLNSSAVINGISVTRSTNVLSDVLSGLTITLNKAQASGDSAVTLTTSIDNDNVASTVQPLLDKYNEALRYLQSNSKTVGREDSSVRSLTSQVRGLAGSMYGSSSDETKYLTDVGIKIGTEGTLTIGDKDRLKTLLESDPTKVSKIFTGTGGFAQKLSDLIDDVTGSTGTAQKRSTALGTQISALSKQLKDVNARIDRAVETQKREYTKLQETYYRMQDQASQYSGFIGSSGLGYY